MASVVSQMRKARCIRSEARNVHPDVTNLTTIRRLQSIDRGVLDSYNPVRSAPMRDQLATDTGLIGRAININPVQETELSCDLAVRSKKL